MCSLCGIPTDTRVFICLFYGTVSNTVQRGRADDSEQLIGKDMEGNCRGPI
jgi:hypothetical protein